MGNNLRSADFCKIDIIIDASPNSKVTAANKGKEIWPVKTPKVENIRSLGLFHLEKHPVLTKKTNKYQFLDFSREIFENFTGQYTKCKSWLTSEN